MYVTEWALRDERNVRRMERLVAAMGGGEVTALDKSALEALVRERDWAATPRTGQLGGVVPRTIIFNSFRWDQDVIARDRERHPALATWGGFLGAGAWTFRDASIETRGVGVCQSAWELHSIFGCLHSCQYCHVKAVVTIMLNLEELAERLPELLALAPEQQLYKYDNQTDQICFEPEYGASELLVSYFARQPGRFIMLYTKSDNVDHLLDLAPGGHTIVSWSLSPERTCREIEFGAPGMEARIEAARRCQKAGYRVRFRFSPIVPLKTWREDMRDMIARLPGRVRPDSITIDVLGWMRPQWAAEAMDTTQFDQRFQEDLAASLDAGDERPGKYLFREELRAEVLGFVADELLATLPDTRVSICNETTSMWERLGPKLGMEPGRYVCCCGPDSVPGNALLSAQAEGGW
jgi:spore photoproduct lyase